MSAGSTHPPIQNYTKIRAAFSSSQAAIDLASIMVGVIVIGLIGGVISATVFAIIPWAQDKAAKASLSSVHTAESAYAGFSVGDDGEKKQTFGNYDDLKAEHGGLLQESERLIVSTGTNNKDCYVAVITSETGNRFWIDNKISAPRMYQEGDQSECLNLEDMFGDDNGGIGYNSSLDGTYFEGQGFAAVVHIRNSAINYGVEPDPTCEPTDPATQVTQVKAYLDSEEIEIAGSWEYMQSSDGIQTAVGIQTTNGYIGATTEEAQTFAERGQVIFLPAGCADSITINVSGTSTPPGGDDGGDPPVELCSKYNNMFTDAQTTSETTGTTFYVDPSCNTSMTAMFTSFESMFQTMGQPTLTARTDGCWSEQGTYKKVACDPTGQAYYYSPGSMEQFWTSANGTTVELYLNGSSTPFFSQASNTPSEFYYEVPREDRTDSYTQSSYNADAPTVGIDVTSSYRMTNFYRAAKPAAGTTSNSCLDELQAGKLPTTYQGEYGVANCQGEDDFRIYDWDISGNFGNADEATYENIKTVSEQGGMVKFTTTEGKTSTIQLNPGALNPEPQAS